MILVSGATGRLGGMITDRLVEAGWAIRALVRGPSRYDDMQGVEAVVGDLKDIASLRLACRGVDAVVTTANATAGTGDDTIESVDRQGNLNLVQAATEAGVRRFVFISALGADLNSPMPLLQAKASTERALQNSGMEWAVLRPNAYMDLLIPMAVGGPVLAGQPVILVGDGHRKHTLVAMRDVVAYVVAALEYPPVKEQLLTVTGPEAVSFRDVVAAFEQELGRQIPVQTVAPGQPVPGLPDFAGQVLALLDSYDSPIDTSELAASYGVQQTPLRQWIREFLAASTVSQR